MGKKVMKYLSSIVLAVCFAVGCVLVQGLSAEEKTDVTAEQNAMIKDRYNGYGLETGTGLSNRIVYESDSLVCYEDRILRKFQYDADHAERIAAMAEGMLGRCASLDRIYVLPVPHRILVEEGYENEKELYLQYLDLISEKLPDKAVLVNALPALEEHKEEYIFFRTEDSWTAKGAYYGMEELCRVTGLQSVPLDRYEESMYCGFTGSLAKQKEISETENFSFPIDRTYYYMLPGAENKVEIIQTDLSGETIRYKKPLITPSAGNTGAFIASSYTRAIVEGDACDEEKRDNDILVVCDASGKMIVPFLKQYYAGVYVVNVREDYDFYKDINRIVDTYHIKEIVFAQNGFRMGATGYYRALADFCEKE